MYQVGDNIVYPMHGAGVIEAVEEKEIGGVSQKYFVITMSSKMKLMIPTGKIGLSGVRPVEDQISLKSMLNCLQFGPSDDTLPWRQRYNNNMAKLKTGHLLEGAEVVRDLMRMNKKKPLNTSERQMLQDARKILISEVGIIAGITQDEAGKLLDERLEVSSI
ncbi:transcription factor YdeB [Mesobacillus campisalis]|uniref:Transcription factor YdeB n=1 Tax=Mesobacillus campisalis TaxID=1408103 RepID=A0A0M2T002_9BACI|nr:CarD family transcriptional regulator [Mesobacillus campisalis]KKK38567.1 transcription factor YdeB [Mesobacillus campisalis]